MGTVFLTGYLSEDMMIHEHYEQYVEIMTKDGRESEILPMPGASDVQRRAPKPVVRKMEVVAQSQKMNQPQVSKISASDLPRV